MNQKKFILIIAGLLFNLAALLLLAWIGFRKPHVDAAPEAISIQLGRDSVQRGIQLIEWTKDGATEATNIGSAECSLRAKSARKALFLATNVTAPFVELHIDCGEVTADDADSADKIFRSESAPSAPSAVKIDFPGCLGRWLQSLQPRQMSGKTDHG